MARKWLILFPIVFSLALGGCNNLPAPIPTNGNVVAGTPYEAPGSTDVESQDLVLGPPANLSGSIVFQKMVGSVYQIFFLDFRSGQVIQLTDQGENIEPSFSADGKQIIYACKLDQKFDLCTMDVDGGNQKQITSTPFDEWSPDWSPDGTKIVYVSNEIPYTHIYLMEMSTGISERATELPGNQGAPEWSPDGKRILFASDQEGYFNIYSISTDGTGETKLTNFGYDDRPSWSHDGKRFLFRRIVVSSSLFSGAEIFVADMGSDKAVQLTNNTLLDDWPIFSPDGKWIMYSVQYGGEDQLVVIPSVGGVPAPIVTNGVVGSAPDWMP